MTALVTEASPGRASTDERLDLLTAQVAAIAADLRRQRESREQWEELVQTLVPVSRDAFDLASRELDGLSDDVTVDDAIRFARTLARSLPQLERLVAQLQGLTELGAELTTLGGAGFAKAADVLAEAERVGYFAVAHHATRPELVGLLDRVLVALGSRPAVDEPAPSTLALLRSLRDPQTRRGLARALILLQAVGAEPTPATDPPTNP